MGLDLCEHALYVAADDSHGNRIPWQYKMLIAWFAGTAGVSLSCEQLSTVVCLMLQMVGSGINQTYETADEFVGLDLAIWESQPEGPGGTRWRWKQLDVRSDFAVTGEVRITTRLHAKDSMLLDVVREGPLGEAHELDVQVRKPRIVHTSMDDRQERERVSSLIAWIARFTDAMDEGSSMLDRCADSHWWWQTTALQGFLLELQLMGWRKSTVMAAMQRLWAGSSRRASAIGRHRRRVLEVHEGARIDVDCGRRWTWRW